MVPVSLPIDEVLPELCEQLENHHQVVLIAPPGAGKTTRVPLSVMEAPWLGQQKLTELYAKTKLTLLAINHL